MLSRIRSIVRRCTLAHVLRFEIRVIRDRCYRDAIGGIRSRFDSFRFVTPRDVNADVSDPVNDNRSFRDHRSFLSH